MSSSMLEQAVIDAQALKEAAIKNAEQEVLDKYAGDIKEAVEILLEQPVEEEPLADPLGGAEDPLSLGGEEAEPDEIVDKLSTKATEGEPLCPCPEDGEEVELDLDALMKAAGASEEDEEESGLGAGGDIMYETSQQDLEMLLEENDDVEETEETEETEEVEIDEKELKATIDQLLNIDEILKVDLENVPRGALGTTHPTKMEQEYAVDVALAAEQDDETKERTEEWKDALQKIIKLEEQVKSLKSDKNRLVKEHNELKSVAYQVSDKLTELNTANAKLVYQNRILKSHSLNERQKNKLVEAVSSANSTEEAKVIYETLQDSLSSKEQNAPQNLNEAVSKNNRLVLKSNKKEEQVSNSVVDRMKKLAGII